MHDWFRHTEWDEDIESEFERRLKRAKDKIQPLKIQAAALAETHPSVAIDLIKRYFASGDTFFQADAHHTEATARMALGDVAGAVASYEAALRREAEFPNLKTNSYVEYPLLIAEHRLTQRYELALRVLAERKADLAFPVQRFMWYAARALILSDRGESAAAAAEAREALLAAEDSSSGFSRHQTLGLVGDLHSALRDRLRKLIQRPAQSNTRLERE